MTASLHRLPVKQKAAPKFRRLRLTNESIDALKPPLKHGERAYDDQLGGFYIEPLKRGGFSFRVLADPPKSARAMGMPKTLVRVVGRYPEMSAGKARAKAAGLISTIKDGTDPTQPERNIEGPTLAEALQSYIDALQKKVAAGKRQPSTITFYNEAIGRLDKLVKRPLAVLGANRQLLKDAHARITTKNGKVSADHSMVAVRAIYNHALKTWSDLPANPVVAVEFNGIPNRSEDGMGLDDLAAWWKKVEELRNPIKSQLLLFMALTGLRSNDARTAKLVDLDETDKVLHIPCPKGGPSRAFDLPLSDAALACIHAARAAWETKQPRSEYLFPSAHAKGFFANPRVEKKTVSGERDRSLATGHKLRHTFATCAEAAGFHEETYGVLLNHKAKSVTGKYANRAKNMNTLYRTVANDIANLMMKAIAS